MAPDLALALGSSTSIHELAGETSIQYAASKTGIVALRLGAFELCPSHYPSHGVPKGGRFSEHLPVEPALHGKGLLSSTCR